MEADLDLMLYPLWHVPWWQMSWFIWTISILFVLLILLVLFLVLRIKRKHNEQLPWQRAMQELKLLSACKDLTLPEMYWQLTLIMKRYIIQRYGSRIDGKTDHECILFFQEIFSPSEAQALAIIFSRAATIKFAGNEGALDQLYDDVIVCMHVVECTIPIE